MTISLQLVERLRQARHIAVLSGAGVSQESGIPTFRDALTGLWEHYDPQMLATPQAYAKQPEVVWGWYEWRRARVLACRPNAAHRAIAAMGSQVPAFSVITQNVDDLHERAGSREVIHLHGSLHAARCSVCDLEFTFPPGIPDEPEGGRWLAPPACTDCGAPVRPGVVWFGEPMPQQSWRRAEQAMQECDVLLVAGTSAVVYPAAQLPVDAARRGACVVQVNAESTGLDTVADYTLQGKAGHVLPALVEAVWGTG